MPMGCSRTKWINDAICEKLDREQPHTIGIQASVASLLPPAKTVKGPYVLKYGKDKRWQFVAAKREHQRLMREKGMSPGVEALIELGCIKRGEEMSQKEKDAIMEGVVIPASPILDTLDKMAAAKEAQAMAEPPVSVQPVSASASPMEEQPLVNVAAPAMEEDADFWGDEDAAYHKIKAKASRR